MTKRNVERIIVKILILLDNSISLFRSAIKLIAMIEEEKKDSAALEASRFRFIRRNAVNRAIIVL